MDRVDIVTGANQSGQRELAMQNVEQFDVVILDSGQGGKLLAWHLGKSGKQFAVVERRVGVDHQSAYLKAWLDQAAVVAIDEVRVQPTLLAPDPQGAFERAKQAATDLADTRGCV